MNSSDPTGIPARAMRSPRAHAGLKNLHLLIQLRWIAVIGQIFTIEVAHYALNLTLPTQEMLLVVACLGLFNVVSMLRWRTGRGVRNVELFLALLIDVAVLTVQLYLSGGTSNPFVFLYLLQIAVGAMLLRGGYIWTIVVITAVCFFVLANHHIDLPLAHDLIRGLASPYVLGLLVCFLINAVLIVVFITRIARTLRQRDARLATARQRATEEEHVVRMGLLASGAAHELGTPLSTMAVILGDWKRDPLISKDETLREEIAEMQIQVQRCKTIVSGILMSAGETRGEASTETTVCEFLDSLAAEWSRTRHVTTFVYDNQFGTDSPMVSDATLQQMVFNVLDNARDASGHWVALIAERTESALVITVCDDGPGFAKEILAEFGKPYQSSKGRPGGGLGLYLAMNVARTLGGSVKARDRADRRAVGPVPLPRASRTLPDSHGENTHAETSKNPTIGEPHAKQ